MPEESNSITIARPVGDVFAFLADAENDKQWRGGIIEMTRTGGEGVGATYRQIVAGPGGRRVDADVEITEFVRNQRIAFRTTKGPVRPTGSYDLQAGDGGTVVTFRLAATLGGAKKLMPPLTPRRAGLSLRVAASIHWPTCRAPKRRSAWIPMARE